jgi:hypothetical protein
MLAYFVNPGRSYSVEITPDREPFDGLSANIRLLRFGDLCPSGSSSLTLRDTRLMAPRLVQLSAQTGGGARWSFTYPGTGPGGPSDFVWIVIENTSVTDRQYTYSVSETTLYNPLWSTFGGFETFYRIQNTTNEDINVTLTLVNDGGTAVANTTLAVPAGATAPTRNTGPSGLNVPDNQAGQAILTHDGPPGAIQADGFLGNFSVFPPVVLPIKITTARETVH